MERTRAAFLGITATHLGRDDHGRIAQPCALRCGPHWLHLIALFAISVTGLMLTARYTWMRGYIYDFI